MVSTFLEAILSEIRTIRKTLEQKLYSQHEVWDDITLKMSSFAVHSETASLQDVYEKMDSSFED